MNIPDKSIYFMIVQNAEDGYAYGGFESLHDTISHLPVDNSAHIEMTTTINEVVDLNNPCNTCKFGNDKTVLRCRECESPWWKNHEPKEERPCTITEFADRCRECGAKYGKLLEQAKFRWIPVSERLPEEATKVLLYAERNAYDDKGNFRKKVIDIGWQVDGRWHIDGCNGVDGIAWMPLPEPYKESKEEE